MYLQLSQRWSPLGDPLSFASRWMARKASFSCSICSSRESAVSSAMSARLLGALPPLTPPAVVDGDADHHVVAVGDVADAHVPLAAVALLVVVGEALEDVVLELVDQPAMLLVDRFGIV